MTSKINEPSSAYLKVSGQWQECRDAVAGSDAVQARGVKYLPMLGGQTDAEYAAYKLRADFFNATQRTVEAMKGSLFRRPIRATIPETMSAIVEAMTPDAHELKDLIEEVVEEVLTVNAVGLLVDYPEATDSVLTVAQAQALGRRPYVSIFKAETVLGVEYGLVLGARKPVRIRLQESDTAIRELSLIEGVYTVILHKLIEGDWIAGEPRIPLMNGRPLSYIPFVLVSDRPVARDFQRPILLDLVKINLSHYRTTADLEHGAHFTALPTTVITGAAQENANEIRIGSSTVIAISDPEAKVYYHALNGDGLGVLERRLALKEQQMAVLGARVLMADKSAAEAAETHHIKRAGENSILASLANTISRQVAQVLIWLRDWANLTGDISIAINTDFNPTRLSANDLKELREMLQSGAISPETFFENLQAGEIIRPDITFEDEQERIEAKVIDRPIAAE